MGVSGSRRTRNLTTAWYGFCRHIVDAQSFPFQSESYPNLTAAGAYNSQSVYSHTDVTALIQYVPELAGRWLHPPHLCCAVSVQGTASSAASASSWSLIHQPTRTSLALCATSVLRVAMPDLGAVGLRAATHGGWATRSRASPCVEQPSLGPPTAPSHLAGRYGMPQQWHFTCYVRCAGLGLVADRSCCCWHGSLIPLTTSRMNWLAACGRRWLA